MKMNIAAVLLITLSVTAIAFADSLPTCEPRTPMSNLQASGGCRIGNLKFSHFQYNNSGLGNGNADVPVTAANILVTATPFGITFLTDYGIGGGFTNCLGILPGLPWDCIEEEGSLGYDVSVIDGNTRIAGLGLLGGDGVFRVNSTLVPQDPFYDGHVAQIACLTKGDYAHVLNVGQLGYSTLDIPYVCSENPAVLLNGNFSGNINTPNVTPSTVVFSPVAQISIATSLFVNRYPFASNVTPFSDTFYFITRAEACQQGLVSTSQCD